MQRDFIRKMNNAPNEKPSKDSEPTISKKEDVHS